MRCLFCVCLREREGYRERKGELGGERERERQTERETERMIDNDLCMCTRLYKVGQR